MADLLYKKIVIVGLPGSGKTSLACALVTERINDKFARNKKYAYISGDHLFARNIIKVMSVVDLYVAEHMSLAAKLLDNNSIARSLADIILFLDIPIDICLARITLRENHNVESKLSMAELYNQLKCSVKLLKEREIPVIRVGVEHEKHISEGNLVGVELIVLISS